MQVTIRLFARLREVAGRSELTRSIPEGSTAGDAWRALVDEFPALGEHTRVISVAVNEEYARMTAALHDKDEVAFLPPVSGGAEAIGAACGPTPTAWVPSPGERVGGRAGRSPWLNDV